MAFNKTIPDDQIECLFIQVLKKEGELKDIKPSDLKKYLEEIVKV